MYRALSFILTLVIASTVAGSTGFRAQAKTQDSRCPDVTEKLEQLASNLVLQKKTITSKESKRLTDLMKTREREENQRKKDQQKRITALNNQSERLQRTAVTIGQREAIVRFAGYIADLMRARDQMIEKTLSTFQAQVDAVLADRRATLAQLTNQRVSNLEAAVAAAHIDCRQKNKVSGVNLPSGVSFVSVNTERENDENEIESARQAARHRLEALKSEIKADEEQVQSFTDRIQAATKERDNALKAIQAEFQISLEKARLEFIAAFGK